MDEDNLRERKFLDGRSVGRLQNTLRQQSIRLMNQKPQNESNKSRNNARHSHSRPPGLSGKEIGMFYKQRSLENKAKEENYLESAVTLPIKSIKKIDELLNKRSEISNASHSLEFKNTFMKTLSTSFKQFLEENKKKFEPKQYNEFDNFLFLNYIEMTEKSSYRTNVLTREKLPVFVKRAEILNAVFENQVILISGDTGCGKTTQVPQFILDEYLKTKKGSSCNIICTQPRRISAITVAERVAWERTEKLGTSVGYKIRLQSVKARERGSITYCTTGILLKQMESDPLLQDISHIVLDEIHERDIYTDIIIGLLKQICNYRPDLKIILMSATFSTSTFSKYFNDCQIIQVQGTLFPVEEKYLEDILEEIKFNKFPEARRKGTEPKWLKHRKKNKDNHNDDFVGYIEPYARSIQDQYSKFVIEAIKNPNSEIINIDLLRDLIFFISFRKPAGAILVFLPGYDKISKLHSELIKSKYFSPDKFHLYALHSMMPTSDQQMIFSQPPPNIRKVILSTNIAETSITIDDVVYVIDCGKVKMTDYNLEKNVQTLEESWATLANVKQRKGRAGRVQPGICYHVYTRAREYTMEQFPIPEILRSRLESVILNMKMLRINDVENFFTTLLSIPHESIVKSSINILKRIDALDDKEQLTPLGLHLARLPLDPQIGKMILMASIFKCVDPITSVAANLSFKDAFYRPLGQEKVVDNIRVKFSEKTKSDHLMMVNVIRDYRTAKNVRNDKKFCYDNFLSSITLKQLEKMKEQFCELLFDAKFIESQNPENRESNLNSSNINLLRSIVSAGLYPNVAKLRKIKVVRNRVDPILSIVTPEDGKVNFHPSSINSAGREFDSRFFVYYMKQKSSAIYLFDTTMVHPLSILIFGDGVYHGVDNYGNDFIALNKFKFKTDKATSDLILRMRREMEALLQRKALHPGPIEPLSDDANLINAVITVLSIEKYSEGDSMSGSDDEGCSSLD